MSEVAEIKVQYVNPPKEGKKLGSIKSADGQYYSVFEKMLDQFTKGMTCKVEYSSRTGDDGREWRTITKVLGNNGSVGPKNDYRSRANPAEAKAIAVLAIAKECIGKMERAELSEDKLVA